MEKNLSKEKHRPGVGIAVFITSSKHPNSIILGKRLGNMGSGLYQLPGGHLEFGETWESAASREVLEETGLKVKNLTYCTAVNSIQAEIGYHYTTIFMKGDVDDCEPKNMEPDKCEGWKWIDWQLLPSAEQLFWPLRDFKSQQKNPFNY